MAKTGEFITVTVLVLAPLPLGSVDLPWVSLWTLLLSLSLGAARVHSFRSAHFSMLIPVCGAVLLFGLTVWVQCRSGGWLGLAGPAWKETSDLLGSPLQSHISVVAAVPYARLSAVLLIALAFLNAFIISTSRDAAWRLLSVVLFSGTAYALYAIADRFLRNGTFADPSQNLSWPFANRNHAATYYGMVASILLLVALSQWRTVDRGLSRYSAWAIAPGFPVFVAAVGSLVCLTATLLTMSRGGTLATLAVLCFSLAALAFRWLGGGRKGGLAVGVVVLAGGILVETLDTGVAYRIGSSGMLDESRLAIYKSTMEAIRDNPLFGTGLGTFERVVPAYRSPAISTRFIWEEAHSVPLQFALEMGLPLAGAMALLWIYIACALFRGFLQRRRDAVLPLCGLAALAVGTAHSVVDFPLQVPGYATVWAALIGLGMGQCVRTSPRPEVVPRAPQDFRGRHPVRGGLKSEPDGAGR
jgi:O-antigen ligase